MISVIIFQTSQIKSFCSCSVAKRSAPEKYRKPSCSIFQIVIKNQDISKVPLVLVYFNFRIYIDF